MPCVFEVFLRKIQEDGSYRRNRMQDARPPQTAKPTPPPCPEPEPPHTCHRKENAGSSGGFLKQLLPRDFDTGDLIVVLLLLLMAGDCEEDRNNAILTLALYFIM